MFFITLKDAQNNTLHTQQIKMVKITCKLYSHVHYGTMPYHSISDYDVFDLTFGSDPLEGIQTPVFDETKVPVMPQGGFLGAVVSALSSLAKGLSDVFGPAILALWLIFVAFLDTIAGLFGAPKFFTNLFNFIGNIISWFVTSIGYVVSMLLSMFLFLGATMGKMVNTLTSVVNVFVSMIQKFFFVLDQGWGGASSLWDTLNLGMWVTLAAILYPIYLLYLWEEEGLDAVISQLKFIMDVLAMLIHGFITVIQITIDVIGRIIEAIPIVE